MQNRVFSFFPILAISHSWFHAHNRRDLEDSLNSFAIWSIMSSRTCDKGIVSGPNPGQEPQQERQQPFFAIFAIFLQIF